MECKFHDITGAEKGQLEKTLNEGKAKDATFTIVAEKASEDKRQVKIKLTGENLSKKDLMSESDPYFVLGRMNGKGNLTPVYVSEVIKNEPNPDWNDFSLSMEQLCNGDLNQELSGFVFDKDRNGKDDIVGRFRLDLGKAFDKKIDNLEIHDCQNQEKINGKIKVAKFSICDY